MARSPITGLVEQFKTLTSEQQAVFLDLVDPQVEPEQPAKKTRKKRTTKSAKAQSLESAIKSSHVAKAEAPKPNGQLCTAMVPGLDVPCGEPEDALIHDPQGGYTSFHPFVAAAPVAEKKTRRKAAAGNSGASSETGEAAAISVSGD